MSTEARLLRKILLKDYCAFFDAPPRERGGPWTTDEGTLVIDNRVPLDPDETELVKKVWEEK